MISPEHKLKQNLVLKMKLPISLLNLSALMMLINLSTGQEVTMLRVFLGHDDILKLVPACVEAHPLLRRIVAKAFHLFLSMKVRIPILM